MNSALTSYITSHSEGASAKDIKDVTGNSHLDEVSLITYLLSLPEFIYVSVLRCRKIAGVGKKNKNAIVLRANLPNLGANGWRYEPIVANSPALILTRNFILDCQDPLAIVQSTHFADLMEPFDSAELRMEATLRIFADSDFCSRLNSIPSNDLTKDERSLLTGIGRRYFYAGIGADDDEETRDRMKAVEMLGKLDGDFIAETTTKTQEKITINIGGQQVLVGDGADAEAKTNNPMPDINILPDSKHKLKLDPLGAPLPETPTDTDPDSPKQIPPSPDDITILPER